MKNIILMIVVFVTLIGSVNAAQFVVPVHGVPISCTDSNGQLVPFFADINAAQAARPLGGARADFTNFGYSIALDLQFMNSLQPLGAFFVMYHECAHVALPMGVGMNSPAQERNADCDAIRSMRAHGLISNMHNFYQAMSAVIQSGGAHRLNQQRIQAASNCL